MKHLEKHDSVRFMHTNCSLSSQHCGFSLRRLLSYSRFCTGLRGLAEGQGENVWQGVCLLHDEHREAPMLRANFSRPIVWPKISAGDVIRFLFLFCVGALLLMVVLTW